uniref:GAF domain-containing protein n=1 Tax=Nocardioides lijunqiniae TaxID=2760832 RepID=UPI001878596E
MRPEAERLELRRWLSGIAAIGAAVSRQEPLDALLGLVARTACELLDYDFCGVFLPDASRGALVIRGYHGLSPEYVEQVNAEHPILLAGAREGEAPTSRAFRTAAVVTLADIEAEPRFGPWGGVAQEQGYRALVSVPLLLAGEVVGTLNCYRRTPHHFTDAELELVSTLATQVAIALVTAQLRASELATIEELRKAADIHTELTSTALRREGVDGVAHGLARLVGRPVLVEDVAGAVLAAAPQAFVVPGGQEAREVDVRLAAGTLVEVGADDAARVGVGVLLEGGVVARVWCAGALADLSGLDVRALEHAAVVAALELLRERTAAEVESRLRGSLVADLLAGDADRTDLAERARRMGHDLSAPYALIAISGGEAGLRAVTPGLRGVQPPPLATVHRGVLVLLWPQAASRGGEPLAAA